jgi:hypothetical protein
MTRKRVAAMAKHQNYPQRCKTTRPAKEMADVKLRTHSVDKIVSKALRTVVSACSIREKFPRLKMWQDFRLPYINTFPQFLTFFVDKIVSKGLALVQSL